MEYKFLGKTGTKVSELCLGAMTFGTEHSPLPGQCDAAASKAIMDRFVAAGGNFIDTADCYQKGDSERIVGAWLEAAPTHRDEVVLATKVRMPAGGAGVNNCGLGRKHIMSGVARSLEYLRTDHVDLLQIHAWDAGTPIEETLRTLDDLVRRGSVHYVGASNVAGWQLQKALSTSEFLHLAPFVTLQPQSVRRRLFFFPSLLLWFSPVTFRTMNIRRAAPRRDDDGDGV